jgi:UDP-N-acetylmuramoyl-L-alanyl-D-glutamate--2,6-diaminopimelate ligase
MKLSMLAREPCARDPDIVGLASDSRNVRAGYLFAALPGLRSDGREFIPQAEEKGAAAILAAPGATAKAPLVVDPNPRRRLACMSARFYERQPEVVAGVTGTNGKTSTARFAAQLWSRLGRSSGSIGTLGAEGDGYARRLIHTTPDPIVLHETLAEMADRGTTHVAIEASSIALAQHRVDGVRFAGAAFTNLTQDHLDYHASLDDYFGAKLRIFSELAPKGGFAVVNADGERAEAVIAAARARGLEVFTTGARGHSIRLLAAEPGARGLGVVVACGGVKFDVELPLVGVFQAENALLAAGIVMASGEPAERVLPLLPSLEGANGRMQRVAEAGGGSIYIDYAHTPDAVASALRAIRLHAAGKIIAIIGAGGDRDRSKRPLMGAAAAREADVVIVTDDNPRKEDPAAIRRAVLAGAPGAIEIGDRRDAIEKGVALLAPGDILLIAGKGHETGQEIGERTLPFDDAEAARRAAADREARGR